MSLSARLMRYVCLAAILSGFMACNRGEPARDWPPEARALLEPLTTSSRGWRADDLGEPVVAGDRVLLERFLPRVWIGPHSTAPIDFYETYLPQSVIRDSEDKVVVRGPSREELKARERTMGLYVDFEGDHYPCRGEACRGRTAPLYGTVFHEELGGGEGLLNRKIAILRFSAVFPASGLPMGLSGWQRVLGGLAGDLDVWHELDMHGAYFLIVDEETAEPLVVLLAQHNHFRTFIVGQDWAWPEDDRVNICYADRSNEPYPCPVAGEPATAPATGQPSSLRYIFTGKDSPMDGSYDLVHGGESGGTPLETKLLTLSEQDPLYSSWINLGDKRKIFWFFASFFRFGPPGMNLNRFPKLKSHMDIARFYYLDPLDEEAFKMVEDKITNYFAADVGPLIERNSKRFNSDLAKKLFNKS
jgi:hypothetical protein